MESEGRRLHGLAAQAREDGNHLKSLQLADEAMLAYQKDGDKLGLSEVIADRSIVLRHLADERGDDNFRRLAKAEMVSSVEIARQSGQKDALALPLFNLAKTQEELGELQEAVSTYKEAVENMKSDPPKNHNRPAILSDMLIHLSTCEYRAGDKTALERATQSLTDLEASDEGKYNKDVWVSGTHMRIARCLKADDPEKAKEHLQKAKEIIDANPELKLRATQLSRISKEFGF